MFTGFHARAHTHIHACTPTHTHIHRQIVSTCAGIHKMPPIPHPTLPAQPPPPQKKKTKKRITTTACQVPELSQSTDWIDQKFYEVWGHPKWFSLVISQYALSLCQHFSPYICFEGVVELCSWLWLVAAVVIDERGLLLQHISLLLEQEHVCMQERRGVIALFSLFCKDVSV